jgi:hypothetical protein
MLSLFNQVARGTSSGNVEDGSQTQPHSSTKTRSGDCSGNYHNQVQVISNDRKESGILNGFQDDLSLSRADHTPTQSPNDELINLGRSVFTSADAIHAAISPDKEKDDIIWECPICGRNTKAVINFHSLPPPPPIVFTCLSVLSMARYQGVRGATDAYM